VLFKTGSAIIQPDIKGLLLDITRVLQSEPNNIRVEGHTDSIPIATKQFPSNWELSATRSTAVVRLLIRDGMKAPRLGAAGYGDQRSRASNATAAGRALNRRVEIVVLRRSGLQGDQG
jgi:chemotaxis protein MotB